MLTRRAMIVASGAALAGVAALGKASSLAAAAEEQAASAPGSSPAPGNAENSEGNSGGNSGGGGYKPVVTPNGSTLPFKLVDGVKVFHLVAQEVEHEFAPGLKAACWGYNGSVHGPTIEAVEGDRVRVYVTNRLPAPTTVHWHGVILPSGMDGVAGLSQRAIEPGETFKYEWTFRQHGTLMYHSHFDEMTQMGLGMMGMIVIHPRPRPRKSSDPAPDRDYVYMLSEWKIVPGTSRPDPTEMTEFNVLTLNGKCYPATAPLLAGLGQRVRIRIGNLGAMEHHPIHLHGYNFQITATEGGDIPAAARWPAATVLVPVGSTRTIEFVADNPGDWALHCHMTHHTMNQMGHAWPNMIGVDKGDLDERMRKLLPGYMTMGQAGMGDMGQMGMPVPPNSIPMVGGQGPHGYIAMGGMFTILKVRQGLAGDEDPGWYKAPAGTEAGPADAEELRRDGVPAEPAATAPAPVPGAGTLYTCPMHPQVISRQPGKCPICGMQLVPKK